jgi:transcriptional regulator GlxA family with amidase domain
MEVYRRQLDFIVEFAIYIIRANDAPVAQYKTEAGRHLVDFRHRVPLVMEVIRLVGKEFSGPVEVSKLAALVNCNPDYMNRIFRQQTGMTVHEYLARVRIDHALKLMRVKTFSLAEVASTCGFADQSHFSRTFKKYMGFPPSQYAVDECLATAICGESFAKLPTSVRRYEANKKSDRF